MSNNKFQNTEQIRQTLNVFARENGLFEIRTVGKIIYSGYFKDVENLLKVMEMSAETWYFVLNDINEACYSREQCEKIVKNPSTTSDSDIIQRSWILIDCDPKRASGISATDGEKKSAHHTAGKIYSWLRAYGFEEPVIADSGNGYSNTA
jgi:hypothetical protein